MSYLNLPISTNVNKFIPKNAFDAFTNAKQKKKIADTIEKITWSNKLLKETINLTGKEIIEIHVIEIKLKEEIYPKDLLEIIDKSIPHHTIFVLSFKDFILFHTAKKHQHLLGQDICIIDWSFATKWFLASENIYQLNLKISLDFVYADFCSQLSNYTQEEKDITKIIYHDKHIKGLKKQIALLENYIIAEKQFNKKVELNIQLRELSIRYLEAIRIMER
jgi:hypothetical protein